MIKKNVLVVNDDYRMRFASLMAELSFCVYFPINEFARKALGSLNIDACEENHETAWKIKRAFSLKKKIESISRLISQAAEAIDDHEKSRIAMDEYYIPPNIRNIVTIVALCADFERGGKPLNENDSTYQSYARYFRQESRLLASAFLSMGPPELISRLVFHHWNQLFEATKHEFFIQSVESSGFGSRNARKELSQNRIDMSPADTTRYTLLEAPNEREHNGKMRSWFKTREKMHDVLSDVFGRDDNVLAAAESRLQELAYNNNNNNE